MAEGGSKVHPVVPEALQWEILRWVPVKSLLRFKCVSVARNSMITNPSFAAIYGGGSRGLITLKPPRWGLSHCNSFYFSSMDIDDDHAAGKPICQFSHYSTVNHHNHQDGRRATNVVDGLICFYLRNNSWLYNVATRAQLPSFSGSECWPYGELETAPGEMDLYDNGRCVYSDGFLYWFEDQDELPERLVAFDLAQEEFQLIPLPTGDPHSNCVFYLPDFGRPAIMYQKTGIFGLRQKSVYSYWKVDADQGRISVKEESFLLPSRASSFAPLCFGGILPNGKVLTSVSDSFYLFDPSKRENQDIGIKKDESFGSVFGHRGSFLSLFLRQYYKENIISLRCLTSTSK
ncbi:OLC1v1014912C1 [Oldenlandia corymbosa var. corymbosa]|uniref:OLC1v1014912C1 n=1 Tax=Oldenlandia corymbosa var. corymbosa TaxID=529605 RepID=A0AAV1E257_OLDCO|nr:OLC1v1014912C1 [Oldenlandia corymbosa var. corymbosa]